MKQKLEFPLFYLLWVAACVELILSFGKDCDLQVIITGIVLLACTSSFVWASTGSDVIVAKLCGPLFGIYAVSIILSFLISGSMLMPCFVGGSVLLLRFVERGYV